MAVSSPPSSSLSKTFTGPPHFSISSSHPKPSSSTLHFKSRPFHSRNHLTRLLTQPIFVVSLAKSPFENRPYKSPSRFFQAPFASQEEDSTTTRSNDEDVATLEDVKVSENEEDGKSLSNLKPLITAYKEAILNGDEKTISELEAMIYMVENELDELVDKVSSLSAEVNSGQEKYIRLQADFDNFRKRSEKEKVTIRSDTQGEVIESLLPMMDNFERAKQQIKLGTEKEKKIDASYQGIYKQFLEVMKSLHVSDVETVGKPFDPSVHEAIAREESNEFDEGIISQEFRSGFLLEDRLLRPAMVKVSAGPGNTKRPTGAGKSTEQLPEVEMGSEVSATAAGADEQ